MAFIAKQPCALAHTGKCCGRVQVDHAGAHGLGQRSVDNETIPLCTKHHRQKTDYSGYFKNWNGPRLRAWLEEQIYYYQQLYAALTALRQTPWRA